MARDTMEKLRKKMSECLRERRRRVRKIMNK